jgi:hypothetical protein
MAFQMLAIILASVFFGIKLDSWLNNKIHIFTIVFSMAGVALSIYFAIKDLIKMK